MGLGIKKDIATSLTSLIFVVVLIGGLMVTFPLLELSVIKVLILFGIVFVFTTILNFTHKEDGYFKKYIFVTAIVSTIAFFLSIPNSSANYEKYASPKQIQSSANPFVILGNNITIQKTIKKEDLKESSFKIKPIV